MANEIGRRSALRLIGTAPIAVAFTLGANEAAEAAEKAATAVKAAAAGKAYVPKFFNPQEWKTVRILVDMIIPKDERSGSATDAGVPEFMDFMMVDQPTRQTAMRGGLAWIDRECLDRHDKPFLACTAAQQTALLDDIAWPQRGAPALAHGINFFTSFRDLTSSGFWTTKMGIDDLQYLGNTGVAEWKGCPEEVVRKLGLTPQA
jgi:gluconate 2-dehydrogenase gamma chain